MFRKDTMRFVAMMEKFQKLKAIDLGFGLKGARHHQYELHPIPYPEIVSFEQKNIIQFPQDYKDYLEAWGYGAGPGEGIYAPFASYAVVKAWEKDLKRTVDFLRPFSFISSNEEESVSENNDALGRPIHLEGIFPVSHLGVGVYAVLVLKGVYEGKVMRFHYESKKLLPFQEIWGIDFIDWVEQWIEGALKKEEGSQIGKFYAKTLKKLAVVWGEQHYAENAIMGNKVFLDKQSIKNFKNLDVTQDTQWISFRGCGLKNIPNKLFEMKSLQGIDLSYNQIMGMYAPFKGFQRLREFVCKQNLLKEIPSSLRFVKKIQVLDFSENQIHSIPDFIGNFEELEALYVSGNQIKEIHPSIARCKKLKRIDLSYNQGVFGFNALIGCPELSILDLTGCELQIFPYYIAMMNPLRKLLLMKNHFTQLPDEIVSLTNLEILYLSESMVDDLEENIERISALKSLKTIYIPYEDVLKLPSNIHKLKKLQRITFYPAYPERVNLQRQEWIERVMDNLKVTFSKTTIKIIY